MGFAGGYSMFCEIHVVLLATTRFMGVQPLIEKSADETGINEKKPTACVSFRMSPGQWESKGEFWVFVAKQVVSVRQSAGKGEHLLMFTIQR